MENKSTITQVSTVLLLTFLCCIVWLGLAILIDISKKNDKSYQDGWNDHYIELVEEGRIHPDGCYCDECELIDCL